jgi:hypothetical protein
VVRVLHQFGGAADVLLGSAKRGKRDQARTMLADSGIRRKGAYFEQS